MEMWMIYAVSFGMLYVVGTIIMFILFRKPIREQIRKWFMISKGYAYVLINDPNHHQQEHFIKIDKDRVSIKGKTYIINPKKVRYRGKAALYEYRHDSAEPIDPYEERLIGTDAEFLDNFLAKMKSLARLMSANDLKIIFYSCIAAFIGALIAAGVSYYNYTLIDKLVQGLL